MSAYQIRIKGSARAPWGKWRTADRMDYTRETLLNNLRNGSLVATITMEFTDGSVIQYRHTPKEK